jgi:cell division protein FtsL
MPGYWLKLISLRISDTQLRSLCLKGLLYANRLYMKLCPSIVLSAMFLVIHDSSALKLLLLKLSPAINP